MRFRLIYEGKLYAPNNKEKIADHKHEIRRQLHPQLRQLWISYPYLRDANRSDQLRGDTGVNLKQYLAEQYTRNNYEFIPLVTEEFSLSCGIEIMYLRPARPGGLIIGAGDIDNRLKTLFDALQMPKRKQELGSYTQPAADETPFYCLLADDKLITHVSVETDILLNPNRQDENDVTLIMSVTLLPYGTVGWNNIAFVG